MATIRERRSHLVHEFSQVDTGGGVTTACGARISVDDWIYNPRDRGRHPDQPNQQGTPMAMNCQACASILQLEDPAIAEVREQQVAVPAGITVPPGRGTVMRTDLDSVHEYVHMSGSIVRTLCNQYFELEGAMFDPRASNASGGEPLAVSCSACYVLIQARGRGIRTQGNEAAARALEAPHREFDDRYVHWHIPLGDGGDSWAACGNVNERTIGNTKDVTCPACQLLPEFKQARIRHVELMITHLILSVRSDTACGSLGGLGTTKMARVTCLDCLKAVEKPAVEGPPVRRILLDGIR